MPWCVADPGGCLDLWADNKSEQERLRLLDGIAELADRPLTELPGRRVLGSSPMNRWEAVGTTAVFIRVYESAGLFDLVDLQDF